MKKILFSLLFLAATLTSMGQTAGQSTTVDGVNYELYANGYWRAKVVSAADTTRYVVIPDSVEVDGKNYPVTLIGDRAFQNNTNIVSAKLCDKLESVGDYGFDGCTNLVAVDFGKSIATVWQYSFRNCSSLTQLTIPASLNSFKYGAFDGCKGLERIDYEGTLDQWASITIQYQNLQANPLYFAHNLYIGNQLVTSLDALESVTTIADCAFAGATCLQGRLDLPASLTKIGSQAFNGCTNISGVNYKGTLSQWAQTELGSILSYANGELYIDGKLLEKIELDNSVTKIANYAFQNLTCIKGEVNIPSSVLSIGYYAFSGCTGITSVTVPDETTSLSSSVFQNCTALESAVIGNGVTKIDIYTFQNCTALKSVTLGSAITSIGDYAFDGCTALECELPLPSGLTKIGNYAFNGCGKLKGDLVIPDAVTTIGNDAFNGCAGFTSLDLGKGVTELKSQAFKGCTGFKGTLTVPSGLTKMASYVFQGCSGFSALDFQSPITSIPSYSFYGCSGLQGTLTLPSGITNIENNAFSGCSGLTGLALPETLTSLGGSAFSECSGLTGTLKIPDAVTTINSYAFSRCTGIKDIEFGNGIKNLYQGAFYNCAGLDGVITLPEAITSIPESCFWQAYGLKGVVIGPNVTSIGTRAFSECTSMEGKLVIPESVKTIGEQAFDSCNEIPSLQLGAGVEKIGGYAFSCKGLQMIQSDAVTPPTCQTSSFTAVDRTIPVYVPTGSEEEYKSATAWRDFMNIASDPVFVQKINVMKDGEPIEKSATVAIGNTYTLKAEIEPEDATIQSLTWTLDDTAAINLQRTDDGSVTITPIEEGEYQLTVASMDGSGVKTTVTLVVERVDVAEIILTAPQEKLHAQETVELTIEITPSDASDKRVTWTSSNPEIATVDSNGVVTTLKSGETEVTVTSVSNPEVKTSCTIVVNPYIVSYYVDGTIYRTQEYDPGETVDPLEAPEKTGYSFDGWKELPDVMPAQDVEVEAEYTAVVYHLTYLVDGQTYKVQDYFYGEDVKAPEAPVKRGHTFTGWDALPSTMPAEDVTVNAEFDAQMFTLTYMVDNEKYDEQTFAYGAAIEPLEEPERTGYTFSGWIGMPTSMPDEDVVVTGYFTVNNHKIDIYIDGEYYATLYFDYGDEIVLPEIEVREDREFDSWQTEIPSTMPDSDLEIYGVTRPVASGLDDVVADHALLFDVYNVNGVLVKRGVAPDHLKVELTPGIYILRNDRIVKKVLVK